MNRLILPFFRYDVIYATTMHRELNSVAVSHFDERAGT